MVTESIASTMKSGFASRRMESTVDASAKTFNAVTRQSGLMRDTLSRAASAFHFPIFFVSAISCRFIFVKDTLSPSIRVRVPIPDLARASTVKLPTPPMPKTVTDAFFSLSTAYSPMRLISRSSQFSDITSSEYAESTLLYTVFFIKSKVLRAFCTCF